MDNKMKRGEKKTKAYYKASSTSLNEMAELDWCNNNDNSNRTPVFKPSQLGIFHLTK